MSLEYQLETVLMKSQSDPVQCAYIIDTLWSHKEIKPFMRTVFQEQTEIFKGDAFDQGNHKAAYNYNIVQYKHTEFGSVAEKNVLNFFTPVIRLATDCADYNDAMTYDKTTAKIRSFPDQYKKEDFVRKYGNHHLMRHHDGIVVNPSALKSKIKYLARKPLRAEEFAETTQALKNLLKHKEIQNTSLSELVMNLYEDPKSLQPLPQIKPRYISSFFMPYNSVK